jgi:hypothetical protein
MAMRALKEPERKARQMINRILPLQLSRRTFFGW